MRVCSKGSQMKREWKSLFACQVSLGWVWHCSQCFPRPTVSGVGLLQVPTGHLSSPGLALLPVLLVLLVMRKARALPLNTKNQICTQSHQKAQLPYFWSLLRKMQSVVCSWLNPCPGAGWDWGKLNIFCFPPLPPALFPGTGEQQGTSSYGNVKNKGTARACCNQKV